ncbi:hypothetical protein V5799_034178 [Amblyomma americanum]|uniref:Single domain-containing protein n=1 Tax=Amblyomma americanum TaxID=6943 RepID=A0AAQ4DL76_AMBAM
MLRSTLLCMAAAFAACVFESSEGRFLSSSDIETTGRDCVGAIGQPAKEGYSVSKKHPCQLETCHNGTWKIDRCLEDMDPKCHGQLGTRGPGPYPDCCALAVYCSEH